MVFSLHKMLHHICGVHNIAIISKVPCAVSSLL